jgi:hypothetical protein
MFDTQIRIPSLFVYSIMHFANGPTRNRAAFSEPVFPSARYRAISTTSHAAKRRPFRRGYILISKGMFYTASASSSALRSALNIRHHPAQPRRKSPISPTPRRHLVFIWISIPWKGKEPVAVAVAVAVAVVR